MPNLKHTKNYNSGENKNYDIIVFCHLRWDTVYQKPQHIINSLSQNYKILFVEEPIQNLDNKDQFFSINSNLDVLQPCILDIRNIPEVLNRFLGKNKIEIGWFYSSNFIPIFEHMQFNHVIYDSLYDLSLCKQAPKDLIERERKILNYSDIVFTWDEASYIAKKQLHSKVFCLSGTADSDQLTQSKNSSIIPIEMINIPSPVIGYYGKIDEKIDLELIHQAAFLLPSVSFVMLGPVTNIHSNNLPKENNIFYLEMKSDEALSDFLKAFDLAMLPVFTNEASNTYNPSLLIKYIERDIPIISTPIKGIIENYARYIKVVNSSAEFIKEIHLALNEKQKTYLSNHKNIVNETTLSDIIRTMERIIFTNETE